MTSWLNWEMLATSAVASNTILFTFVKGDAKVSCTRSSLVRVTEQSDYSLSYHDCKDCNKDLKKTYIHLNYLKIILLL